MFGIYFGRYLVSKGVLTLEQYNEIISDSKSTKVKMGFLAVEAGVMTEEQADEVNMLQQTKDSRFGDIAIEKGYLTEEQVAALLKKQGDEYLLFVQALVDRDIMSLEEIQKEINAYKKSNRFTALDIEAIKSGDVDRIVPVFTRDDSIQPLVKDYVALTARNLVRFIDSRFQMEQIERVDSYEAVYMATQEMDGDYKLLTGFCGDQDGLKLIGESFIKREYAELNLEEMDILDVLDILDAACEFLNCNNGLYATRLSHEDIELDMCPPEMRDSHSVIRSDGNMYKVPFYIKGKKIDLIICIQSKWKLN
jgi:CheY-specific phosphatase CheX